MQSDDQSRTNRLTKVALAKWFYSIFELRPGAQIEGLYVDPAWNMLLDARSSDGVETLFDRVHRRSAEVYDKLFRSNNLPAMTPPGAEYYPTWTAAEIQTLAKVLQLGTTELRQQLGC